jgi:1-acyl-sn-glycerol-3-phosphate acyltransferase
VTPPSDPRWRWPHAEPGAVTWWRRALQWFGKDLIFRWILLPLTGGCSIYGAENLPRTGGAVLASNHVSFADPPWIGACVHRRVYAMAKRELFEAPIFGWIIHSVFAFPVDRSIADHVALRHGIDLVSRGELLLIFPEGGRSPDGEVQKGSIAPAMVAGRVGVPILPVAIVGTDRVLPRGAKFLHHHRTAIAFGEPMTVTPDAAGRLTRAVLDAATTELMDRIRALRAFLLERLAEEKAPRARPS